MSARTVSTRHLPLRSTAVEAVTRPFYMGMCRPDLSVRTATLTIDGTFPSREVKHAIKHLVGKPVLCDVRGSEGRFGHAWRIIIPALVQHAVERGSEQQDSTLE